MKIRKNLVDEYLQKDTFILNENEIEKVFGLRNPKRRKINIINIQFFHMSTF